MWGKNTMLVTIIFSYSHNVFYPINKQEGHELPCITPMADTKNPFIPNITILGNWFKTLDPEERTKIGSHSSNVQLQKDFKRFHYINPCKICESWVKFYPTAITYTSW